MSTIWKHFKIALHKLDPITIQRKELLEARIALLEAQTALEYSTAIVTYNEARIKRLSASIRIDEANSRGEVPKVAVHSVITREVRP